MRSALSSILYKASKTLSSSASEKSVSLLSLEAGSTSLLNSLTSCRSFGSSSTGDEEPSSTGKNAEGKQENVKSSAGRPPSKRTSLKQLNTVSQRETINPFDFVLGLYMGDARFRALTNGEPENTQRLLRILASISPTDLKNPLEERMKEERRELMQILEDQSQQQQTSTSTSGLEHVEGEHVPGGVYASEPRVFHKISANGQRAYAYSEGLGTRKTAKAHVTLSPAGTLDAPGVRRFGGPDVGLVVVNGAPFDLAFPQVQQREHVMRPFQVTGTVGKFDLDCKVQGGGPSSRAQAIATAIAKALQSFEPKFTTALDAAALLTPDARKKERKKPGRLNARKRPQWSKR